MPENKTHHHIELTSGNFSKFFIVRPVATTLLICALLLIGIFAFPRLPVAPLPQAEFPTIQVSARLPGASPETMASAVATPLEVQLTGVPGIKEMTSTSALGSTSITLEFVLEKNIDTAAQEVQAALNAAAGRLPNDMPDLPTWRKVNPADSPILVLTLQSDLMSMTELSDWAETTLSRQLSQIQGVADIRISGQMKPSLRLQISPDRLASLGLTMDDVRAAAEAASVNRPKGNIFGESRSSSIETNDQLFDEAAYKDLVVAYRNGAPIRIGNLGNVKVGPESTFLSAWQNDKPGINLIISRQPDANIIATVDRINEELPRLKEAMPASVQLSVLNDRTATIRASLHEVEITLIVAAILVVVIMGVFLRQLPATLIVGGVLITSIVGTFAVMYALGFSLNNLTLVALVIAVGFVVDDAIVVIENIFRNIEEGMEPYDAAVKGAGEIGFTVVSIGLSLIAAFIPLLFMGGVVGRLFKEFALTVTSTILVSIIVSLTLAPMLASRYMKRIIHQHDKKDFMDRLNARYEKGLDWVLQHQKITFLGFLATLLLTIGMFVAIPKGFFPLQDTGFVLGTTQAAQDISFADMKKKHQELSDIIGKDPAVQSYGTAVGATGGSQTMSSGRFWISLKPRGDRDVSASEFIDRIRSKTGQVTGINLFLRAGQDINLGGGGGRAQYTYALKSSDGKELSIWAERLTEELKKAKDLKDVSNDQQLGAGVTKITIDRAAAARLGVTVADIDSALYNAFGERQINEYQTQTNQYKVVLELDPSTRGDPNTLNYIFLRSSVTGDMIPLSMVSHFEPPTTGPLSITHQGMFPAVNISFNLTEGAALGNAVKAIEKAQHDIGMPVSITGNFRGTAQAFKDSLASQPLLILAALLAVYIILGVLYENFIHPLTILSTLPSAGLGAVIALKIAGMEFTIMALIGIILLIGIVKKNGILMIDFAIEARRNQGMSAEEAIREACLIRFRPILMTTIAALLGAIPLIFGFGAGAELRQPLGVAVVGGLIVSQMLTLFSTPVIYLMLERLSNKEPKAKEAEAF